jgi:hypothetical protein
MGRGAKDTTLGGLALVLAIVALAAGLIALFYAMLFSNSDSDTIPDKPLEFVPWFAFPLLAVGSACWSVREVVLLLASGRPPRAYGKGLLGVVVGCVGFYATASALVG